MELLEEIRGISRKAARTLEEASCYTDSDIRTLTQQDLHELLPGVSNFRTRKKIYEIIHQRRPIHVVLNELKSLVPDESFREAFNSKRVLHEYLQTLKELKVEINHVQEFLDAHIDLLEKFGQNQDAKPSEDQAVMPSGNLAPTASSAKAATNNDHMEQKDDLYYQNSPKTSPKENQFYSQKTHVSPSSSHYDPRNFQAQRRQATVAYKTVISGKTLNRHLDVMGMIRSKSDVRGSFHLEETQSEKDCQVIIVFCPIASRAGTDVEKALEKVSGNKPIILVMMHHSRTAQPPTYVTPCHRAILVVSVFFHETMAGLLKCSQNDDAIASIQSQLQSFACKS